MMDDAELLHQYATERSESAFAELVRRHVDLVYSVALRTLGGDAHAAQDVSQAVFLALARNAAALTSRRALAGWIYLTTHHIAAQRVRADRRRQNREQQAHTMNDILQPPDIDWQQLRPTLDQAMQDLSELDREAILLRYYEQRPFVEIGRSLRVTEDAARMRVDRALEKLRALLARRGVSSTAAALAATLGHQLVAAPAGLATAITSAALASAMPAAAAGFMGTLMTSTNLIIGTVALGAVGTAVFFAQATTQRSAELDLARQERAALHARVDGLEARLAPDRHAATTALDQTVVPAQPAVVPAAATAAGSPEVAEEHEGRTPAAERQAEFARQLADYDSLFRRLGLTPTQVEQFRALLMAKLSRNGDLKEFARTDGARPVDPDVQALDQQAEADLINHIRAAFGDSAVAAYQHHNETGAMRELTGTLAHALAPTVAPLTHEQADALVEILANNSRTVDGRISDDPHALNLEAALAQAQTLLSPLQLAALRQAYNDRR